MDDIGFINQSITLCRGNVITSLADDSNEAEIASIFYPSFVKDVFSRYPWSFALKKRQLNRSGTSPVNEWTYLYSKPTDMECLFSLYSSSSVGAKPTQDFDIIGDYINTNLETPYAEYTIYADENSWPGYFIDFARYAFAALIALPLTDDQNLADRMQFLAYGTTQEQEKGGKFSVAASRDAQQKPPEELGVSELIAARFA